MIKIIEKLKENVSLYLDDILDDIDYQYLENSFSSETLSTIYQALEEEQTVEDYFLLNDLSSLEDLKNNLGTELLKSDENSGYYLELPHSRIHVYEEDSNILIHPILNINLGNDNYIDFNVLLYEKYNGLIKNNGEKEI